MSNSPYITRPNLGLSNHATSRQILFGDRSFSVKSIICINVHSNENFLHFHEIYVVSASNLCFACHCIPKRVKCLFIETYTSMSIRPACDFQR
jgi:hypothetical protein